MVQSHIFFHIDVNSAFLSWSAISELEGGNPVDLRNIPSIVGGDTTQRHGVVLAKSIPAKAYGIKTGEPIIHAVKKCPTLINVSPDFSIYKKQSNALMELLSSFSPDLEQVSIDECYMDFTPISHAYESPLKAAALIKEQVFQKLGFTVNIGISDQKVLAKMASDFQKPNLIHTLFQSEIRVKMWPLSISKLYMCGQSSVSKLRDLEILTIGDLAQADVKILTSHLKSHGTLLWNYANGIDSAAINSKHLQAKGIGNSTTLREDATTQEEAFHILLQLSESVASRLRKALQAAYMVSCEIKYSNFQTISHQTTLYSPSADSTEIYHTACKLFEEVWDGTPIRLLGIRTSKLVSIDEPVQLSLFDYQENTPISLKQQKLNLALDAIKNKYGDTAVVRGSLHYNSTD